METFFTTIIVFHLANTRENRLPGAQLPQFSLIEASRRLRAAEQCRSMLRMRGSRTEIEYVCRQLHCASTSTAPHMTHKPGQMTHDADRKRWSCAPLQMLHAGVQNSSHERALAPAYPAHRTSHKQWCSLSRPVRAVHHQRSDRYRAQLRHHFKKRSMGFCAMS